MILAIATLIGMIEYYSSVKKISLVTTNGTKTMVYRLPKDYKVGDIIPVDSVQYLGDGIQYRIVTPNQFKPPKGYKPGNGTIYLDRGNAKIISIH